MEVWEEGYATKELEGRKTKLKEKRQVLQDRWEQHKQKSYASALDELEAKESIERHLQNLLEVEEELVEEEKNLNDEKGAHIRALKRVASEDASRFRSRPKVRLHHSCVGCVVVRLKELFVFSSTDRDQYNLRTFRQMRVAPCEEPRVWGRGNFSSRRVRTPRWARA